jgi:hypothetical protein
LEEGTAPVVGRATVEELAERVEQAKAYMDLLGGLESVMDRQVQMVIEAWARAFGAQAIEGREGTMWQLDGYEPWPSERSLRRVLRTLTLADVLVAVDIAAAKFEGYAPPAVRYFFGVCWKAIREDRPLGDGVSRASMEAEQDYALGVAVGGREENAKIRDLLANYSENGYTSLADAVLALWPEE